MTREEIAKVRQLAREIGVSSAATALGISRQSLLAIIAGTGVKSATEERVSNAIERGETHGNAPATRRRA